MAFLSETFEKLRNTTARMANPNIPVYGSEGYYKLAGLPGINTLQGAQNFLQNNKFKPFSDLTDKEKQKWKNDYSTLNQPTLEALYNGLQFKNTFGQDFTTQLLTQNPQAITNLDKLHDDLLAQSVFEQYYKGDSDFGFLQNTLTAYGKRKMIEEGILNNKDLKNNVNAEISQLAANQRDLNKLVSQDVQNNLFGGFAGQAINTKTTDLLGNTTEYDPWLDKQDGEKGNGERVITREQDAKNRELNKRQGEKQRTIADIIKQDDEFKIQNSLGDAEGLRAQWETAMANNQKLELPDGTEQDYDVYLNNLFYKVFAGEGDNKKQEKDLDDLQEAPDNFVELPKDENGNTILDFSKFKPNSEQKENFNGTNHWKRLHDEYDLDNMPIEHKLDLLSKYLAVTQNYGMISAAPVAETLMQDYIAGLENPAVKAQKHLNRLFTTGVEAQIMNAIMEAEAVAVEIAYGKKGMYEWLQGRDASGDGTENSFLADPAYWQKVEQYNTYSPKEIKLSDKYGGISPNNPHYSVEDEQAVWSLKNVGEMAEMSKFVIAQYIMSQGVGALGNSFKLPKGLTYSLELGVNAAPIALSYSYNAYNEVMDKGKAQLAKLIDADAAEWAKQQQTPDEKGSSASGPVVVPDQMIQPFMEKGLTREEAIQAVKDQYDSGLKYEYYKQKGIKFDEDGNITDFGEYNEDFENLQTRANHTFLIDNAVEFLRYAGATATIRKYMLSPASQEYASKGTAAKLARDATSKAAQRWHKIKGVAGPFVSGGLSNYLDEVTTGYSVGFGMGEYNNYLAEKYDPEGYVLGHHQVSSEWISGLDQAAAEGNEKFLTKQSAIAFILGAGGSFFGPMLNITKQARQQVNDYYGIKKGEKASHWWQALNRQVTIPAVKSYQNAVMELRGADEYTQNANKTIAKRKDDLDDIANFIRQYEKLSDKTKTVMESKDAKEQAALSLALFLNQAQENTVLQQNESVQKALQTLAQESNGEISQEQISSFLAENQEIKNGRTEEEQKQFAAESIQKNAQRFVKMQEKVAEVTEQINKSKTLKEKLTDYSKVNLIAMLAREESWKERLAEMEKEISGNENTNTESARDVATYYSTEEGKQRMIDTVNSSLEKQQEVLGKLQEKKKQVEKDLAERNFKKKSKKDLKSELQALELQITDKKEVIQQYKNDIKFYENNGAAGDLGYKLTADEILNLSPQDRARMLNDKYRRNYSKEQQAEIDKAKDKLKQKNPEMLQMVQDAATLAERLEMNGKAKSRVFDHLQEYNDYISGIVNRRNVDLGKIYKSIRKQEIGENLAAFGDDAAKMHDYAKEQINKEDGDFNPGEFIEYVTDDIKEKGIEENQHPLYDLMEATKLRLNLMASLDSIEGMTEDKFQSYADAISRQTVDGNSAAEVMQLFQDLIDQQTSPEVKEVFSAVAKKVREAQLQKDATKIIKQRNAQRAKNDGSYWGWEGFHVGGRVHTDKGNGTITEFKRDSNGKPYLMGIKYDNPWKDSKGNDVNTEYLSSAQQTDKAKVKTGEIKGGGHTGQTGLTVESGVIDLENGTIDNAGQAAEGVSAADINPLDDIDGISSDDVETQAEEEPVDTSGGWTTSSTLDVTEVKPEDYIGQEEGVGSDDIETGQPAEEGQVSSADVENAPESTVQEGEAVDSQDVEASPEEEVIDTTDVEETTEEAIASDDIETQNIEESDIISQDDLVLDNDGMALTPQISERATTEGEHIDTIDKSTESIDNNNKIIENSNKSNPGLWMGNYYVLYHRTNLQGLEGRQVLKTAKTKGDTFDEYLEIEKELYGDSGGNTQEVIDNELPAIMRAGAKIQFAMFPVVNGKGTRSSTIFNVVEYTPKVQKIHKSEHGLVECGGKKYLVVGTLGFDRTNLQQKISYNQTKQTLYKERLKFFEKGVPSAPLTAYVSPTFVTEIASAAPGYITHQLLNSPGVQKRSVLQLIGNGTRSESNPHGITLGNIKWGIQYGNEVKSNVPQEYRYDPTDPEGNLGASFIYVPTLSGMYIPLRIDTCTYKQLKGGSKLKEDLDKLFHDLLSTDYNVRKTAITQLVQKLYMDDNKNILIGTEQVNCITLVVNGVRQKPIQLNSGISREAIIKQIENIDFKININEQVFQSPQLIRMYSEAGAMQLDVAKLGTSGSLYSVYQCDATGKMIKPENTDWTLNKSADAVGDFERAQRKYNKSTLVGGIVYREIDGVIYDDKYIPVTDPETLAHVKNSLYLRESGLTPSFSDGQYKYYVISKDPANPIVWAETTDNKIYMASPQITKQLVEEKAKETQEQTMAQNAQDVVDTQQSQVENTQKQAEIEDEAVSFDDIDISNATSEEVSLMNLFGVDFKKDSSVEETPKPSAEEKKQIEKAEKDAAKENSKSDPNETGKVTMKDLNNSKKITTFAQVIRDGEYRGRLTEIAKKKGWISEKGTLKELGTFADQKVFFAEKGISLEFNDVEDFFNEIDECF